MADSSNAHNASASGAVPWEPTDHWMGRDGTWNVFEIRVGTPPQGFVVTPAISQYETWVPDSAYCLYWYPTDAGECGSLRGAESYANGSRSPGFNYNLSSTWKDIGIWTINLQNDKMGFGTNARYGNDTVTLGDGGDGLSLPEQTVGSLANADKYWMGQFGIQRKADNFSNLNAPSPSYMTNLLKKGVIPSESWGYTAGAVYRNYTKSSLTFGGYDANRVGADNITMGMYTDDGRPFMVGMRSIHATATLKGAMDLLPTAIYSFIDSTFPWIWLPDDAIAKFVDAFGLTLDNDSQLYIVNDTVHDQLLKLNPTLNFTLSESTNDGKSKAINITLPYAAFDLNGSVPIFNTSTRYFPIRRATNDSQHAIGRAFLQEAYLIADWSRGNFTVSQASFNNTGRKDLVTIHQPAADEPTIIRAPLNPGTGGSALGGATIAGIVVGTIGAVSLLILGWLLCVRQRQKRNRANDVRAYLASHKQEAPHELSSETSKIHEAASSDHDMEKSRTELATPVVCQEMSGLAARHEMASPIVAWGPIAEADSHEYRAELVGDTPKEKAWR